ncbi:MAG: ABC transporter permease, partial [Paracoccaceae bacterium]|nr:ABC transporter permease [Paracoccaceae bacterium]
MRNVLPILTVVAALVVLWYGAAIWLNAPWAHDQAKRAGVELSFSEVVADTWAQDKPRLPAPHQVVAEIWKTTVQKSITSKRSLIFHSWITMSATVLGFALGTALGFALAIGIVYNRVMDM